MDIVDQMEGCRDSIDSLGTESSEGRRHFWTRVCVSETMWEWTATSVEEDESVVDESGGLITAQLMTLRDISTLPLEQKERWFRAICCRMRPPEESPHDCWNLTVHRSEALADSLSALMDVSPEDGLHRKIHIHFVGEEGVDAGGLTREWFRIVSEQIFDLRRPFFAYSEIDNLSYQISPSSVVQEDHLRYFEFTGRFLSKALFEGCVIPVHFVRSLYKQILHAEIVLEDLAGVDVELFKSLNFMLENVIDGLFFETFSVECDEFGQRAVHDLIPNGRMIEVHESNKERYVHERMQWRMSGCVREQIDALCRGFHAVIPPGILSVFDFQELEMLMCGVSTIDAADWKSHTKYDGWAEADSVVIWFWEAVNEFTEEERARLLQFATGTSRVPVGGFRALESTRGRTQEFTIGRISREQCIFPLAHTCFNRIDLPEYRSLDELTHYVSLAIQMEGVNFDMQ